MTFEQFVKCCCDSYWMLYPKLNEDLKARLRVQYCVGDPPLLHLVGKIFDTTYYYISYPSTSTDLFKEFAKFEDALLELM